MGSHNNIFIMKQAAAAAAIAFFLLFVSPSSTNATPSKLVDGVCKKTIKYADCVSGLGLDHRTSSASDLKNLAIIALEVAIANTTNSRAYIDKLAKDKSTEPKLIPALKQCVSAYEMVAASFNSAKMGLDEDIQSANYDAKVAGDGADLCESLLKVNKVDVPSVRAGNYYVKLYSDIGFVITDQIGG